MDGESVGRAPEQVIAIWPGVAPGSEQWTRKESTYLAPGQQPMVRNVVRPTLTTFLPKTGTGNGTAVIVAPGGGFRFLSWESEGTQVARWLRDRGVTAFVLKYRLVDTGATDAEFQQRLESLFRRLGLAGDGGRPVSGPLDDPETKQVIAMAAVDGRQAVRVVRRRASEWGVSPDRVGIIGFSAGSLVAGRAALEHDAESRPDFVGTIYGAPSGQFTMPADAPPLFILCADDDPLASRGSARMYSAWKDAGRPVELHIYAQGGHGFGMNTQGLPADTWIERFRDWLDAQGMMEPAK